MIRRILTHLGMSMENGGCWPPRALFTACWKPTCDNAPRLEGPPWGVIRPAPAGGMGGQRPS